MRIPLLVALAITTAGCASSGGGVDPDSTPRVTTATERVVTGGGETLQMNAMNIDTDVRLFSTGTPDQAWSVLSAVYAELGIPLTMNNAATKSLGNTGWRTRRQIGGVRMYNYLDCGGSGNMQNAETYSITMSIVTTVKPNPGGGSVISTAITAIGRNPVTSSSQDVRCATLGNLEIRIRDMVQKRVEAM
jgi:hypothetical protein